jgi:hypothetical protein
MLLHKLTLGAACGFLLAAAGIVLSSAGPDAGAAELPKPRVHLVLTPAGEQKLEPAAKPGPGSILLMRDSSLGTVTPDGKPGTELNIPDKTRLFCRSVPLSPDGKRAAFVVIEKDAPILTAADDAYPLKVVVQTFDKSGEERVIDMPAAELHLCWTADGKKLVVAKTTEIPPNAKFESVLLDPGTGKTENFDLPASMRVLECVKDGKTFVVETFDAKTKKKALGLIGRGEDNVRELAALKGFPGRAIARLSTDGTRILLLDGDPDRKDAHKWGASERPYLLDVKTGQIEKLADFPENGRAFGVAWSPDGKRLAYTWQPLDEELLKKDRISGDDAVKETEGYLIIADADGKNSKTIVTDKGPFSTNMVLGPIDWR